MKFKYEKMGRFVSGEEEIEDESAQAVYVTDLPIWYGVPAIKKLVNEALESRLLRARDLSSAVCSMWAIPIRRPGNWWANIADLWGLSCDGPPTRTLTMWWVLS